MKFGVIVFGVLIAAFCFLGISKISKVIGFVLGGFIILVTIGAAPLESIVVGVVVGIAIFASRAGKANKAPLPAKAETQALGPLKLEEIPMPVPTFGNEEGQTVEGAEDERNEELTVVPENTVESKEPEEEKTKGTVEKRGRRMAYSAEANGIKITVRDYAVNKSYECPDDCFRKEYKSCALLKTLPLDTVENLAATEADVLILNATDGTISTSPSMFRLIDSDGYEHVAELLCDELIPKSYRNTDKINANASTRKKVLYVFPELEEGRDISAIVYSGEKKIRVDIGDMAEKAREEFEAVKSVPEETTAKNSIFRSYYISNTGERTEITDRYSVKNVDDKPETDYILLEAERSIKTYKELANSYMSNVLVGNNVKGVLERLENLEGSINRFMQKMTPDKIAVVESDYVETFEFLHRFIDSQSKELEQKSNARAMVTNLYELSPTDFEKWIAELLPSMGYTNIALTPMNGDHGVDIKAEKDGKKAVVQCKRWKGVVGAPDIQKFIGAIQIAEADVGLYITTGLFTAEARKTAEKFPIEMYDKHELAKLFAEMVIF